MKRTLILAALMATTIFAANSASVCSNCVTWNGLATFMAAFYFVEYLLTGLLLSITYGSSALLLGLVGGAVSAVIAYIVAKLAIALIK